MEKHTASLFRKLNDDWNADPNAPEPRVRIEGTAVVLSFVVNHFLYTRFAEDERVRLRFTNARRWRLGPTNDEGWYRGKCRFSSQAPAWGEFYEVTGDVKLEQSPLDWQIFGDTLSPGRHFLFYLRDETFECEAEDWTLEG